ncbi:MAG: hypothetical protein N4A72_14360 [Bacteroidales bacterium]|nr:hypothetical protein [Bacteroidales bacterium]
MRRILFLSLLSLLMFSCASKRYAKKAVELERAGLYQEAANLYYLSVKANRKNIDALIGLKKNGEMVLADKLNKFKSAWETRQIKEAVYAYREAKEYRDKLSAVGAELTIDSKYNTWYSNASSSYLSERYTEALGALNREDFSNALTIFTEILNIDSNYKDAKQKYTVAKFEPMYRAAIQDLNTGRFRKAYYSFVEVQNGAGEYKETSALLSQALEEATITILVVPFRTSSDGGVYNRNNFQTVVLNAIGNTQSPFYKVKDLSYINNKGVFFADGTIDLRKVSLDGIDAVISGDIKRFKVRRGKLHKKEKPAYLKIKKLKKNSDGTTSTYYEYKKVVYTEVKKDNAVHFQVDYKMVSTKTGDVLAADIVNESMTDRVHYGLYYGEKGELVPGYWKYKKSKSDEDKVYDDYSSRNRFDRMFRSKRSIKSVEDMRRDVLRNAANRIAQRVEMYNPEM